MFDAAKAQLQHKVQRGIDASCRDALKNLSWLNDAMPPYFAITMQDEPDAVAALALRLDALGSEEKLVLSDRERRLILARRNRPGSLYHTMQNLKEREISYAQFIQSLEPLPGLSDRLELQRFEFDRKRNQEISEAAAPRLPERIKAEVTAALRQWYPGFDLRDLNRLLGLLWLNNEQYVRISPAKRIAQVLWMYQQSSQQGGIYFDLEQTGERDEYRVMFAVGNPPQLDFLMQTMEVFNRLEIGVRRAFCLTISNGVHPYFLGTFYVKVRDAARVAKGAELYERLREELYNTQILSTSTPAYRELVAQGVATGEEASLVNAIIGFCHTNLAHNQPDRFGFDDVSRAFLSHPDMTLQLVRLFKLRFDPRIGGRARYGQALAEAQRAVADYNTGHRHLDEIRRTVFGCALCLITHTLKTNFFVAEKHALAFRLDPGYLEKLGPQFCSDLPAERPFRITYFFGRHGAGYHIGFSDIARGGWRTILTKGWDDYVSTATTLFRENYVLAHTQHLKNKDIYEGGSKMVVLLDAADLTDHDLVTRRLYKLQYGFINAFFDIFVTRDGQAADPRVIDYYGEDEPIELGPDENMHDSMVELVAQESVRRGYLLGIGVISSKKAGINHKEYGVTSIGVVKFAEIALAHLGIDMRRDPFSVFFTGGPNGDVAGNAMRLMLERCPKVAIRLIMDGSAALSDRQGADHEALRRIVLSHDVEAFDPVALHPGGFIIYRNQRRTEGMRELHKKVTRTAEGVSEEWITVDEYNRLWSELIFASEADLFLPAGGRPETVAENNWHRFLDQDGHPKLKAVVEGANSFFTPGARLELQRKGILILRDASANKCGVISSSYEIIANLLMSEREFLEIKESYVADVLEILEQRAEEEARLIFKRRTESGDTLLCTEISAAISHEINAHYARLFSYFQSHPALCEEPLFVRAMGAHLPRLLREHRRYRQRLRQLPAKYRYAILAGQIASSLVYRGDQEAQFLALLKVHLEQNLAG